MKIAMMTCGLVLSLAMAAPASAGEQFSALNGIGATQMSPAQMDAVQGRLLRLNTGLSLKAAVAVLPVLVSANARVNLNVGNAHSSHSAHGHHGHRGSHHSHKNKSRW